MSYWNWFGHHFHVQKEMSSDATDSVCSLREIFLYITVDGTVVPKTEAKPNLLWFRRSCCHSPEGIPLDWTRETRGLWIRKNRGSGTARCNGSWCRCRRRPRCSPETRLAASSAVDTYSLRILQTYVTPPITRRHYWTTRAARYWDCGWPDGLRQRRRRTKDTAMGKGIPRTCRGPRRDKLNNLHRHCGMPVQGDGAWASTVSSEMLLPNYWSNSAFGASHRWHFRSMGQFMYIGGSCKGSDHGFCLIDPCLVFEIWT